MHPKDVAGTADEKCKNSFTLSTPPPKRDASEDTPDNSSTENMVNAMVTEDFVPE